MMDLLQIIFRWFYSKKWKRNTIKSLPLICPLLLILLQSLTSLRTPKARLHRMILSVHCVNQLLKRNIDLVVCVIFAVIICFQICSECIEMLE